tara:strand:- start:42 stop:995 length:954 start_codon:yes stop_codon:yes gene_type:complete
MTEFKYRKKGWETEPYAIHRPLYYISTGRLTRMFTLWKAQWGRDLFITNLCTDSQEAVQKAKDIISEQREDWCDKKIAEELDAGMTEYTLDEIIYRNEEQMIADAEAKKQANIEKWIQRSLIMIKEGIYNPFGKYTDKFGIRQHYKLEELNQGDINYWCNLKEFKSPVHEAMSEYCKKLGYVEIIKNANKHFGNEGDKKVRVKVQFVSMSSSMSPFGYKVMQDKFKFHTEDGARIVWTTTSLEACASVRNVYDENDKFVRPVKEGEWITIEGTVKKHVNFQPTEYLDLDNGKTIEKKSDKIYKSTVMIRVKKVSDES